MSGYSNLKDGYIMKKYKKPKFITVKASKPRIYKSSSKTIDRTKRRLKILDKLNRSKKDGKLARRIKAIQRWAEKARAIADEVGKTLDEFENAGYNVVNRHILDSTLARVSEIEKKSRPSQYDLLLLKDYAKVTWYDYIKIEMNIRGDEIGGVQTTDTEEINLRDIRLARRRQVLSPDKITEKEQQIISQYADAMSNYASSISPDIDTPEEQAKFTKGFKVERDVAIGGSSTLINDLSYTYDALNEGRSFVEMLQQIMKNPEDFIQIEVWYRSNSYIKRIIDEAVKAAGYSKFLEFSTVIIEAINNMPNLSSEVEERLTDFQDRMEVVADERYE